MPIYFTKQGYENHLKRISELENRLKYLQSGVQDALEVGGNLWHDNFSYENLVRDIEMADKRLNEAYSISNEAEVVSYPTSVDSVVLGCKVTILLGNEEKTYDIVSFGEEDILKNKINYTSPLVQQMFGKKIGDIIQKTIKGKKEDIEILDLKPLNN